MKIVNVRGYKANDPAITYCGRKWAGWAASPLGNPCIKNRPCYICKQVHYTPGETIPCYKYWLVNNIVQENPVVVGAMKKLNPDSVLGCWCHPKPCHCEIIVEAWQKFYGRGID